MTTSNLSKIKPKLRTQGAVTGNFGHSKTKAGSPLKDIGVTKAQVVQIAPRVEYINRMMQVWRTTPDTKMKEFAYRELHRLNCFQEQRIEGIGRTAEAYKGPIGAQ
jgi:hypothetical protein